MPEVPYHSVFGKWTRSCERSSGTGLGWSRVPNAGTVPLDQRRASSSTNSWRENIILPFEELEPALVSSLQSIKANKSGMRTNVSGYRDCAVPRMRTTVCLSVSLSSNWGESRGNSSTPGPQGLRGDPVSTHNEDAPSTFAVNASCWFSVRLVDCLAHRIGTPRLSTVLT
jgi:hypothetical protein